MGFYFFYIRSRGRDSALIVLWVPNLQGLQYNNVAQYIFAVEYGLKSF